MTRKGLVAREHKCLLIRETMYFMKYYAPSDNKVGKGYFKYQGKSEGHNVIDRGIILKGVASESCMPKMKIMKYL